MSQEEGVEFLELNAEGKQVIIHRFLLKDDKVINQQLEKSQFTESIEALLQTGFEAVTRYGPGSYHVNKDVREFLQALKYRFNGTYLRATDLKHLD